MCRPRLGLRSRGGFTLIELTLVVLIVSILLVMILGINDSIRARAETAKCYANLRGLYGGAACFVTDQGHWPQISPGLLTGESTKYADQWITALAPYGISQVNWVCPTQQRLMGGPDLTVKEHVRVDYNATPFDSGARTPYKWRTQPWFLEHAATHEGGPLLIYADGQIMTLKEAMQRRQ